jgi:hypothetical protein
VIRGISQDIVFLDRMWESLTDLAAQLLLVLRVHRSLIKVNPYRPLQIDNHWQKILLSGLLHSVTCKYKGDCIHDALHFNISVIKGLNILGFRRFEG